MGAGGHLAEDDFLGGVAAQRGGHKALVVALAGQAVLGLGQVAGVAAGHAAGDDRDLVDGVVSGDVGGDQGVPGFVERDDLALAADQQAALALGAGHDAVDGLFNLRLGDALLAAAGGEDRGLVEQVGKLRAGEAGRLLGDGAQVDLFGERLAAHVDGEDFLAAFDVGRVEDHAAVEAAWAEQGRVEDVGAVGGGDDDHVGVGVKAVHLDQDLVEGLLALVVAAADACPALAAHGVDLVDEHDAGSVALGLLKEVADAACADADEHLDEFGAGDVEERHARFAGDGASDQRFAGARRADQQDAARDAGAERGEALGELEELDDFLELFLGFVRARNIVEGDSGAVGGNQAGLALAERHRLAALPLGVAEEEEEDQPEDQENGEEVDQQAADHAAEAARTAHLHLGEARRGDLDSVAAEEVEDVPGLGGGVGGDRAGSVAVVECDLVVVDADCLDLAEVALDAAE